MTVALAHTRAGAVFFKDSFFALDHRHGRYRLEAALRTNPALPHWGPLSAQDLKHAVFMDIETGPRSELSGSYAFVVGVGRFEPYYFRLRQLFYREPASLEGLLAGLTELLDDARSVVTFNGAGFDLPRLASIFAAAGLPDPFASLQHWDLLPDVRRIYGPALKSRRLRDLETTLLGLERPHRSFDEREGAHPIFDHNAMDVLSMVTLVADLHRAHRRSQGDPRYLVSLGRLALDRGNVDAAETSLRAAWALDPHGLSGADAITRLSRLLGSRGHYADVEAIWLEELQRTDRFERRLRAHAELARLYERRLKRPEQALLHARQALHLLAEPALQRVYARSFADLTKRAERLQKRLGLTDDPAHANQPRLNVR